jgi:hypothetical protein
MAGRIDLAGGPAAYAALLDEFFGYMPDGSPKPPVTQLAMMGCAAAAATLLQGHSLLLWSMAAF